MRIVTTLDHTPSGRPVIRAKAGGRTKSTNYDHGLSHDTNHGHAAAALVFKMDEDNHPNLRGEFIAAVISGIDSGEATHTTENGARHVFEV